MAGIKGLPDNKNVEMVLPYPYKGRHYSYEDPDTPRLPDTDMQEENIMLVLPPGRQVGQLAWISVFCKDYNVDFGHVMFDRQEQDSLLLF